MTISASRIARNARAGVTSLGAIVSITGTQLECNPIHLDGEPAIGGAAFVLENGGGNVCGRDELDVPCAVQTASLAPPVPLSD